MPDIILSHKLLFLYSFLLIYHIYKKIRDPGFAAVKSTLSLGDCVGTFMSGRVLADVQVLLAFSTFEDLVLLDANTIVCRSNVIITIVSLYLIEFLLLNKINVRMRNSSVRDLPLLLLRPVHICQSQNVVTVSINQNAKCFI